MAEIVFSVSQINEYLRGKIAGDPFLTDITVVGEVTNFGMSSIGHAFFSLKDDQNMIGCIAYDFAEHVSQDVIADGVMIKAHGRISLYKKTASLQLVVVSAQAAGLGDLYERFEKTKRKLAGQGLFDTAHKKALPAFPTHIGVVTSAAGAALHDIISVSTRRFSGISITVYPAQVQGQDAARQICSGIKYFNAAGDVDVIIVGRGGGSFEDLFAFNEECVARAVYDSDIPIVSAVGHETDFSLSDMAADLRAPTPSAAAELVVVPRQDIEARIDDRRAAMQAAMAAMLERRANRLSRAAVTVRAHPLQLVISRTLERAAYLHQMMRTAMKARIERCALTIGKHQSTLVSLNPRGVLERGYALVYDEVGGVVTSAAGAPASMAIEFCDGRIAVRRKDEDDG